MPSKHAKLEGEESDESSTEFLQLTLEEVKHHIMPMPLLQGLVNSKVIHPKELHQTIAVISAKLEESEKHWIIARLIPVIYF